MIITPMKEAVAAALFEKDYEEPWSEATIIARRQWLDMADCAIQAMDRTEVWDLFCSMTLLLEGAMPLLDKAAEQELIAERGKSMRKVTQQKRFEEAKGCVQRASEIIWGDQIND